MIAKLKGTVDSILDDSVIIDVMGIGYQVFIPEKLKESLKIGESVSIRTFHVFKQESQCLCGFRDAIELSMFKALLDVHGVGLKTALSVLSALTPEEFASAIADQDSSLLGRIHGIGKKTAERILLELKDGVLIKLGKVGPQASDSVNDAVLGLVSLGYQKSAVLKNVISLAERLGPSASPGEIIVTYLRDTNSPKRDG
jgi:Holliday junction DNA helicase RuvA